MRKTALVALILSASSLAAGLGALLALQIAVRQAPGDTFTRAGIMRILTSESVVYFSDGKTRLGTFFEGTHRDYVPYDSIPTLLVDALVAAEDQNYFTHGGIDYRGIAAAVLVNVKAGKVKRGGSTLSQQAAKNLFNRRGRTLKGKVFELVNTYRLERHFSKKEILEFYLNQFYVSGNGHGVTIASRYFFDKPLHELTLMEAAFIAGSVKGPNQYNPFIQKTEEAKERALRRGQDRVAYVLGQMVKTGKINSATYKDAMQEGLHFKRGAFRFSLSTNMVKVQRLLERPEMQKLLAEFGVEDFMSAGLQIHTTLDADIQKASEYAMNVNLSRLDRILKGYEPPRDTAISIVSAFEPGAFYTGRVCSLRVDKGVPQGVQVRFGAVKAWVNRKALEDFFSDWNRHETGAASLPSPQVQTGLVNRLFPLGAPIYCSVEYAKPDSMRTGSKRPAPKKVELRIEQIPLIQGGAQVVRHGRVLANVGGFQNTGYDRVNQAKRQIGSAFKPMVFAAALELGWNIFDALPNYRQLFRLGTTFYFPKPDHEPEDTVSMAWAGRRSENIASVYLLFHLFDKIDFARFWEVCRGIGMAPENFHMESEFRLFVRDSLGLVFNNERRRELEFHKLVVDAGYDLIFSGKLAEADFIKSLPYGLGFETERRKYEGKGDADSRLRHDILGKHFLNYVAKVRLWRNRQEGGSGLHMARHATSGQVGLFEKMPASPWLPTAMPEYWIDDDSLMVEGVVSIATLSRISQGLQQVEDDGGSNPYSKENLYASADFKAWAALRYIVDFSRKLGVRSPLDAVISFPLGVNVITLGEAVNAYQVFKDGYAYTTKGGDNQLFIEKITLRDGTVLFEDEAKRIRVLSEKTRVGLENILGLVVTGGTGRAIHQGVRLKGEGAEFPLPAFGKTGTTNDYRNGAFLGYFAAPKSGKKGFDTREGYVTGVYVGFDDNTPMVRRGFRGTGSSVAIPAWIDIAENVSEISQFRHEVDFMDLEILATGHAPMFEAHKYEKWVVSKKSGMPVDSRQVAVIEASGQEYREDISHEMELREPVTDPSVLTTIFMKKE